MLNTIILHSTDLAVNTVAASSNKTHCMYLTHCHAAARARVFISLLFIRTCYSIKSKNNGYTLTMKQLSPAKRTQKSTYQPFSLRQVDQADRLRHEHGELSLSVEQGHLGAGSHSSRERFLLFCRSNRPPGKESMMSFVFLLSFLLGWNIYIIYCSTRIEGTAPPHTTDRQTHAEHKTQQARDTMGTLLLLVLVLSVPSRLSSSRW